MKKEDFIKLGFSEEDAKKAADASAEELKTYIPKARFDEVNTEKEKLKTTIAEIDEQIESFNDVEAMKKQINDLQADNKTKDEAHAAEINKIQRKSADIELLTTAKAKNIKAVLGLLDEIDNNLDIDTYKVKRNEQIEALINADNTKFLFDTETKKMKGVTLSETKSGLEGNVDISQMSYEQLEKTMNENQDLHI